MSWEKRRRRQGLCTIVCRYSTKIGSRAIDLCLRGDLGQGRLYMFKIRDSTHLSAEENDPEEREILMIRKQEQYIKEQNP